VSHLEVAQRHDLETAVSLGRIVNSDPETDLVRPLPILVGQQYEPSQRLGGWKVCARRPAVRTGQSWCHGEAWVMRPVFSTGLVERNSTSGPSSWCRMRPSLGVRHILSTK
jgi:hypothetical protein